MHHVLTLSLHIYGGFYWHHLKIFRGVLSVTESWFSCCTDSASFYLHWGSSGPTLLQWLQAPLSNEIKLVCSRSSVLIRHTKPRQQPFEDHFVWFHYHGKTFRVEQLTGAIPLALVFSKSHFLLTIDFIILRASALTLIGLWQHFHIMLDPAIICACGNLEFEHRPAFKPAVNLKDYSFKWDKFSRSSQPYILEWEYCLALNSAVGRYESAANQAFLLIDQTSI